jgi:ribosome modulation factor
MAGQQGLAKSDNPHPAQAAKKRQGWLMGWEACERDGLLDCRTDSFPHFDEPHVRGAFGER